MKLIEDQATEISRLNGVIAKCKKALIHYAEEAERNERHYQPEFAKKALAAIKEIEHADPSP